MKSNHRHIQEKPGETTLLLQRLQEEKEAMVSMFLANVPQEELSAQFELIEVLCKRVREE